MKIRKYIICFLFLFISGVSADSLKARATKIGTVKAVKSIQRHPPVATKRSLNQKQNSKRKLLDFKMKSAVWLKQYPLIQEKVKKIIQENKTEMQELANDTYKEFPNTVLLPFKLYVNELKLFQPNDKDIVSVRMKIYTYSGGAHGGTQYYNWNWSKKHKSFLSINEMLSKVQFKKLISQSRQKLLKKQFGLKTEKLSEYPGLGNHIYRGTSSLKDFKVWNLHKNQIVVVFPEYQVASYAAGSFELFIPLQDLK